jgi:hypothetical protein
VSEVDGGDEGLGGAETSGSGDEGVDLGIQLWVPNIASVQLRGHLSLRRRSRCCDLWASELVCGSRSTAVMSD